MGKATTRSGEHGYRGDRQQRSGNVDGANEARLRWIWRQQGNVQKRGDRDGAAVNAAVGRSRRGYRGAGSSNQVIEIVPTRRGGSDQAT